MIDLTNTVTRTATAVTVAAMAHRFVIHPAPRQPPTSGGGATAPAAAVASDVTAAAQRVLTYHGRDDLTVDVLLDGRLLHITLRNNNGDGVGTVSVAAAPP